MKEYEKNNPDDLLKIFGFDKGEIKEQPKHKEISEKIKQLLKDGKLWDYIVIDELNKKHIGDIKAKEVLFLCSIGRLVKNKKSFSYNVIFLSKSSAGKDHLTGNILKLFPKGDYQVFKAISPKSLKYLNTIDKNPDWNYNGKIISIEEIEENTLNNEVMKGFTSGEEEYNTSVIPDTKKGSEIKLTTRGKPCVFTTTATIIPSDEIRNRFSVMKLDESKEQTRLTYSFESQDYSSDILDFICSLKSYNVDIPKPIRDFAIEGFPYDKVNYRRAFPKFLDFIRAVTLFYQEERHGNTTNTITADWSDYNKARDIFENSYSKLVDIPLKDIDSRIVKTLEDVKEPLSAKDILNKVGIITISNLYKHLSNLTIKEILDEQQSRDPFGNVVTKFVLSQEYQDKTPFKLPLYISKD